MHGQSRTKRVLHETTDRVQGEPTSDGADFGGVPSATDDVEGESLEVPLGTDGEFASWPPDGSGFSAGEWFFTSSRRVDLTSTATTCSIDIPEAGYFEGECATQQEIDDLATLLASIDYETETQQQEVEAAVPPYCSMNPWDYDVCAAQEESAAEEFSAYAPPTEEAAYSEEGDPDSAYLGPDLWSGGMDAPCSTPGALLSPIVVAYDGCGTAALNGGLATAAWLIAKVRAYSVVMAAAPPPASAVAIVVFGAMVTGYGAASAWNAYLNCLDQ